MKVIIVEDEIVSQEYLSDLLVRYFPKVSILAIVDSVSTAVVAIRDLNPDIVFLDIEIKMGSGFDVLAALPEINADIIFTTAFSEFAIDAFKHHAIDYLLKPLKDEQVIKSINHCISKQNKRLEKEPISTLSQQFRQPSFPGQRIGIHTLEGIDFIEADNIIFAEAKGNYVELNLRKESKMTTTRKLKEMEEYLPSYFFRIHHSYIVNLHCITKYFRGRGGHIVLTNGISLPVSSARKDDFLKLFSE